MKVMRSLVRWLGVFLVAGAISVAQAASGLPSGWTDDFAAAKSRAAAEGKKILLVFSGSDWCGWCIKFDKETLSKGEFVKAAAKNFELVMIDSPKDKSKLSAAARTQNPKLVAQYNVRGYPHYVVTDADGKEIARGAGYVKGGPKAFLSKLEQMSRGAGAPKPAAATPTGWKPKCNCGPECWEKGLCNCCKRNKGNCCRNVNGMTCRQVACWTVCTEDAELVPKVDETASFLEEILRAFDEETSGYFRTMQSYYDGILVHRDLSMRGKRDRFIKGKCYLNLYAPDSLRDRSWCGLFCGGFLSRCKKEPLPDKEREAMLLYVGARVTKKMGIDGGDRQLERFAQESNGMGRVLHELCSTNNAAVRRYYAAKVRLFETDRFGPFLSISDMAEVFSAAAGCDAFAVFRTYGKRVRKEDVAQKLRGFADEPFEEESRVDTRPVKTNAVVSTAVAVKKNPGLARKIVRKNGDVYRVNLVGIASVPDRKRDLWNLNADFRPPQTHIEVPDGSAALFKVEYDFQDGFSDHIWARPPQDAASCVGFGTNPSSCHDGKGVTTGFLVCSGECALESVRIHGSKGEAVFPVDIVFRSKR